MLMCKCRWVRLALVAVWIALPTHVFALGLGEIEVESALNQKLSATIDLVDSGGFQASEILVSMASREDFERVGVERFFYLTNINFEIDLKAQRVVVSSSQPIAEPYLNFIVELHWPQGRLLKEFTVLLDPPTFSQAAAPQVSAPVQQDTQPQRQPAPAGRPTQSSNAGTQVTLSPSQRPSAPRNADGLMTSRNDTLWKIAQSTLSSDKVNVNQQMLAIQRLNPKAFIRNNINLLKAGYVLRIPTESESLLLSANDAKLVVNDQTDDWRTGATSTAQALADAGTQLIDDADDLRSQVDATDSASSTSPTQSDAQGQVRIVANSGELAQGTGTGDSPSSSQLVETNEELNREVDELTYQLDREQDLATNQIELKDRQLEVKDQQLAEMQEQVKIIEEQLAAAKQNQNQSTPIDKEPTPWWSSPMVMGGVIGILVLILAAMMFALRRKSAVEEVYADDYSDSYEPEVSPTDEPFTEAQVLDENVDDNDVEGNEVSDQDDQVEPIISALSEDQADDAEVFEVPGDESSGQETQTGDVVGEADIYVAYGRYGQASSLLLGALNIDPGRHDVRLKLLEVSVEANDAGQFSEHAQYLVENCDDEQVLMACRDLEARLEDTVDLNSDPVTSEKQETPDQADEGEEFSLEEDELFDNTDVQGTSGVASGNENADADEFELEFDADDIEIEDDSTEPSESPENSSAADEMGGDLGIDFDPDKEPSKDASDSIADLDNEQNLNAEPDAESIDSEDNSNSNAADLEQLSEQLDEASEASVDADDADDDFDFGSDADINTTKLDLAEAYIDMGDGDGAQDILKEVVEEGTPEQQERARAMLDSMSK